MTGPSEYLTIRGLTIPAIAASIGCGLAFAGGVIDTWVPGSVFDVIKDSHAATRELISAWAIIASQLIELVTLLVWAGVAAHNVRAMGRQPLRFSPFTTVAWFFIPFANLYMPYRAIAEAWRASEPAQSFTDAKTPWALLAWWLLSLLSIIQDDSPTALGVVGVAVSLASSVLFVHLAFALRDRQQQCAAILSGTVAPLSGRSA